MRFSLLFQFFSTEPGFFFSPLDDRPIISPLWVKIGDGGMATKKNWKIFSEYQKKEHFHNKLCKKFKPLSCFDGGLGVSTEIDELC